MGLRLTRTVWPNNYVNFDYIYAVKDATPSCTYWDVTLYYIH